MARIKESDESAFALLFDRLWERMYLLASYVLRDKERAKDIVQEVWINIWERRNEIQNDNIEAYLLKATRFKIYRTLRDQKLQKDQLQFLENLQVPESEGVLEKLYCEDTNARLEKSFGNLPKKCHQVFILSRYGGLENHQISEKLGISQRTVETHISNAIRRIKSEVLATVLIVLSIFQ